MKSYFNLQVTEFPEQNIFGVKNIIGNVWEWTQDWWETKFTPTPKKNPVSAIIHFLVTLLMEPLVGGHSQYKIHQLLTKSPPAAKIKYHCIKKNY